MSIKDLDKSEVLMSVQKSELKRVKAAEIGGKPKTEGPKEGISRKIGANGNRCFVKLLAKTRQKNSGK